LTATRSSDRRALKYSAVRRLTTDADEAWWPPTFVPSAFGRVFAQWTIHVASHSTFRWILSRIASSAAMAG